MVFFLFIIQKSKFQFTKHQFILYIINFLLIMDKNIK